MNDLQSKILDIMNYVHEFCATNGVEYFMMSGSMLGAIRHKGFIPWDDDIDIGMLKDNYDKFISMKDKFDNDRYEMILPESANSSYLFVKIVDKNTTFVEEQFKTSSRAIGVYVDLFCFRKACDDMEMMKKVIKKRNFYFALRRLTLSKEAADTFKRKLIRVYGKMLGLKAITNKIKKLDGKFDDVDTQYYYDPDGMNPKGIVRKEYIEDGVTLFDFEDTKFYGLKRYDDYLTNIYGDYMTPPKNVSDRHTHDYSYLNLNLPYREYIRNSEENK